MENTETSLTNEEILRILQPNTPFEYFFFNRLHILERYYKSRQKLDPNYDIEPDKIKQQVEISKESNSKTIYNLRYRSKKYNSHNWIELSKKKDFPWSDSLIEAFKDKWDWSFLSKNESLPWSIELFRKFKEWWVLGKDGLLVNRKFYLNCILPSLNSERIDELFNQKIEQSFLDYYFNVINESYYSKSNYNILSLKEPKIEELFYDNYLRSIQYRLEEGQYIGIQLSELFYKDINYLLSLLNENKLCMRIDDLNKLSKEFLRFSTSPDKIEIFFKIYAFCLEYYLYELRDSDYMEMDSSRSDYSNAFEGDQQNTWNVD